MTDRERMIEVIENALQGYSTHDDMPLDEVLEGITPEIADRLIKSGFGRVYYKKNPTIPKSNYKYDGIDKSDRPGFMP